MSDEFASDEFLLDEPEEGVEGAAAEEEEEDEEEAAADEEEA